MKKMKRELKQLRDDKDKDSKKIKDLNNIINGLGTFDPDISQIDFNQTYVSEAPSVMNDKYLSKNYNTNERINCKSNNFDHLRIHVWKCTRPSFFYVVLYLALCLTDHVFYVVTWLPTN